MTAHVTAQLLTPAALERWSSDFAAADGVLACRGVVLVERVKDLEAQLARAAAPAPALAEILDLIEDAAGEVGETCGDCQGARARAGGPCLRCSGAGEITVAVALASIAEIVLAARARLAAAPPADEPEAAKTRHDTDKVSDPDAWMDDVASPPAEPEEPLVEAGVWIERNLDADTFDVLGPRVQRHPGRRRYKLLSRARHYGERYLCVAAWRKEGARLVGYCRSAPASSLRIMPSSMVPRRGGDGA